ncbi:iron-containing alcohol dehydrogenase [Streptomyces sp. NPDC002130]|uniref:iron-containing alcohol dehydrogenase n=1 Tax=Streptomyces sp. NPDC002130 TaxID=3155568 RepID=UPI0033305F4B
MDDSTILVADSHNFPIVRGLGETVLVAEPHIDVVNDIRTTYRYKKVIAVGGCSVLDVGRACAEPGALTVFPSILSHSCLSTDRSVLIRNGMRTSTRTVAPVVTVISKPSVRAAHTGQGVKWTTSGLGDLFSSLSASIEYQWPSGADDRLQLSLREVTSRIPVVRAAVEWVLGSPGQTGDLDLWSLARYAHESSLEVLRLGHTRLNAASEHLLCYRLQERYRYSADRATHGRLVSIGTLLVCAMFSQSSGEHGFYGSIRRLYEKSGLPGSYKDLNQIGVQREHILRGLDDLADTNCLLGRLYRTYGSGMADDVFGDASHSTQDRPPGRGSDGTAHGRVADRRGPT